MHSKFPRFLALGMVATVGILTPTGLDARAEARPPAAADPAVITE